MRQLPSGLSNLRTSNVCTDLHRSVGRTPCMIMELGLPSFDLLVLLISSLWSERCLCPQLCIYIHINSATTTELGTGGDICQDLVNKGLLELSVSPHL